MGLPCTASGPRVLCWAEAAEVLLRPDGSLLSMGFWYAVSRTLKSRLWVVDGFSGGFPLSVPLGSGSSFREYEKPQFRIFSLHNRITSCCRRCKPITPVR